ncbi:methylenetetrahydrofolate reductase [Desulfobacter hydrogenophilus]|uniref:Methylenetetrahydrofolate reductase n=1 Tax=Desulfobacter hydrogenophilus TaxID=2291 RepID=A0A328FA68_9BACT|nr:methylenetetrahydrofolate reductase [Desulfobacter hydrogenophilus]NDY72512.1 methylenetetrahydrofolate reductase [Desulfobacter hydrogenophilus]QBH14158.1 methylenetetrahydrofolate reductase [Desulfobacter hydrogenophilus]RAM01554.1 methylenetetrahydrofolate reductase [Desulfobacter hydrogenophilus]
MKTESRLEKVLASGQLAVTSEVGPPRGCNIDIVKEKANMIKDYVDGINITDNQTAMVRMSSIAGGVVIKQMGLDPIIQMVSRDRNRLAMQADILGAYALGCNTMLCLSGDHPKFGDHPMAKPVYDIDSINMIKMVKDMRDEGKFQGGADITEPPKMFIGAAANPFADPFELRVMRLAKKVAAGVDFIQTQCIFNTAKFEEWMKQVVDRGLDEKVAILAGITPMKSLGMAKYMKSKVPGMDIPDEVIDRLAGVDKEKQAEEGIKMAIEQMQRLKECKGVKGFHIMAIEWEQKVPELVKAAGLYPRPEV